MSVRFILGRSGSGKSSRCLEEIREQLTNNPVGSPLLLLVPEQATHQAEYALAATPGLGGTIRAQVLSFRRMAFRVMQEAGGTARIHISEIGKKMLIHKLARKHQSELRVLTGAPRQMGLLDKMGELFSELKRYAADEKQLEQAIMHMTDSESSAYAKHKLHDVLVLYRAYEEQLAGRYLDSEDYLALLADGLEASGYTRDAHIWIDGFHGFTPQEFQVIEKLMKCSRETTFALCLDKPYEDGVLPHELDLFYPTAVTYKRLKETALNAHARIAETILLSGAEAESKSDSLSPPRFDRSPILRHLERHFARGVKPVSFQPDVAEQASDIVLCSAVNRRAEVEGVAREMLRLARDEGWRWRDMTVMVRNIAEYEPLLTIVLNDYGIPHFFDSKRSVMHHPLVEFIRSALEVVVGGWKYDAIFRAVKTDLLFPLEARYRHAADQLENYALAFGIQGSRWTDSRRWEYTLLRSLEDEESAVSQDEALKQLIHDTRMRIVGPLHAFERRLKSASSVRQMAEALFELLENIHAPLKLEAWSAECAARGDVLHAREHTGIWGRVVDMLDELVELSGAESMDADVFAEVIEAGLSSIRLGLVPPSMDQVLVGSMDRTRSGRVRGCFLLGVNDGVVPSKMSENGILSETEREQLDKLGIELAPGSRRKLLDETFLVYTALTTPSERLWISWPLADDEGKALVASDVIRQVQRLFPAISTKVLEGEPKADDPDSEQWAFSAHPERALSYLLVQLRQWNHGERIADLWWETYNWFSMHPMWRDKLSRGLQSLFYTNEQRPLSTEASLALYGRRLRASVSRMERFAACPFWHFASHGLRLNERRVYRLQAPDIGQLFHAALSIAASRLLEAGLSWGDLSEAECYALAVEAVDVLAPRLQSEILLSSKRYAYIASKLKNIVGRASSALGKQSSRSAFRPVALEVDFGAKSPIPPLEIDLDNGRTMEIAGRIDRIDAADGEFGTLLRIIDYKSGKTSLGLAQVYYGLALQLLTYLDVAVSSSPTWLGRKTIPAGALYFHVHNPLVSVASRLDPDAADTLVMKRYRTSGLVLADKQVALAMDDSLSEGGTSIAVPIGIKKDGEFTAHSSVMTEEQWADLQAHTRQTIRTIGKQITDGDVSIRPYRLGKMTACTYCSYKPVCQVDPLFEGNDARIMSVLGKDNVWYEMASERELSNEQHQQNTADRERREQGGE